MTYGTAIHASVLEVDDDLPLLQQDRINWDCSLTWMFTLAPSIGDHLKRTAGVRRWKAEHHPAFGLGRAADARRPPPGNTFPSRQRTEHCVRFGVDQEFGGVPTFIVYPRDESRAVG